MISFAQNATLEKNILGISIGLNPVTLYDEIKLTNNSSLRLEAGLGFYVSSGLFVNDQWGIIPSLSLNYKYYYNLKRRIQKGKRIDGNSANYFSVGTLVNFSEIAGDYNYKSNSTGAATINYGARRMIGKSFNFEWATGALIPFHGFNKSQISLADVLMVKIGFGYIF